MSTTASIIAPITAQDLERIASPCELIRGEIIPISPSGYDHGRASIRIGRLIANWVFDHDLGEVVGAETGFLLERHPDTVRAPDVAFIAKGRIAASPDTTYAVCPPDLVVEVLSPSDPWSEVESKADSWLRHGVRLVWLVDPLRLRVDVLDGRQRLTLRGSDLIDGGDVLPGFRHPISSFFP